MRGLRDKVAIDGKQPVDLLLDLRRRRYGTSHGVGPPSIVFAGLEGTYAVVSTALGHLQRFWECAQTTT